MWEVGKVERRVLRGWEGVVKGEVDGGLALLLLGLVGGGLVAEGGSRLPLRALGGLAILQVGCVIFVGALVSYVRGGG